MTRRGYVGGALAAVVVVLMAVAVVPRVLASIDHHERSTISADDAYAVAGELTCDTEVRDVPVLPLEAEPVAMLVCADPESSMPWTAPAELVKGDLSHLVAVLSDLKPTPDEPYDCTFQGGPAYDLMLRFSRERVARIHGDVGGCGIVSTAAGDWFGAQEVLDAVLDQVEHERAGATRPPDVEALDLSCDRLLDEHGTAVSLTGHPEDVTRVVSCWRPDAGKPGPWRESEVRPADVKVLAHDLANASPDGDPDDLLCPDGPDHLYFQGLLGQTVWGDLVLVSGECRRFMTDLFSDRPASVWHPSPRAQRILDRLRADAVPVVGPQP